MTRLDKIEQDVASLSLEELAHFRTWFETYGFARFDHRIEEDGRSGRLDKVADTALLEFNVGLNPSAEMQHAVSARQSSR